MSHQPQPSPLAAAVRARQEALEHLASRNPARLSNAGFGYLQSLSADPAALATLFADAVFARAVSAGWRTALTGDTNPLLHTPDETAIIIASFLPTAKDLLHLAMACRRYSIKIVARPASTAAGFSAAACPLWKKRHAAGLMLLRRSSRPGRDATSSRAGCSSCTRLRCCAYHRSSVDRAGTSRSCRPVPHGDHTLHVT